MTAFSPAAERNRDPILTVLKRHVIEGARVLEIGAGTGQHAVYLSTCLAVKSWLATDLAGALPALRERIAQAGGLRLLEPVALDVIERPWTVDPVDLVFTANTAHIMPWANTPALLEASAGVLVPGGKLAIYGPFMYGGRHTAPSNAAFDRSLKARDSVMGIRDAETLIAHARVAGFELLEDAAMPANNRTLVLQCKT